MKNLILIIFMLLLSALCSLNLSAQDTAPIDTTKWLGTYKYEFLEDSASRYSLKQELMVLLVGSKLSKFCNINQILTDSIFYKHGNEDFFSSSFQKDITSIPASNRFARFEILKNFPAKGETYFEAYAGEMVCVKQAINLKWSLKTSKDTVILGYRCQKAGTTFAGRNYTAWYTTQIPISDGPYKFSGLPGLIVMITDAKLQHRFTLISLKQVKYTKPIYYTKSKQIPEMTPQQFVKALKIHISNQMNKFQTGAYPIDNDEHKAKALLNLRSRNNFIEKY